MKCDQKSEAVFDEGSVASGNSREKGIQKVRQRKLAKISEGEARQRDSDLHAGNDRAHVRDEELDNARARVALLDELPNTRLPYGDEREFDGREERVDRDEHKNDEEMEGDHWSESNITGIELAFCARCQCDVSRNKCNRCGHASRNCNKMAVPQRGFENEFAGMVMLDGRWASDS